MDYVWLLFFLVTGVYLVWTGIGFSHMRNGVWGMMAALACGVVGMPVFAFTAAGWWYSVIQQYGSIAVLQWDFVRQHTLPLTVMIALVIVLIGFLVRIVTNRMGRLSQNTAN